MKAKRSRLSVAVLLPAAALVMSSACRGSSQNAAVGVVARGDLVHRVTLSGTIVPNRKTIISPPYSGYVKKLFVKIGDSVKPGDAIVSITQSIRQGEDVFPLRAPFAGIVVQVLASEGEYVNQSTDGTTNGLVRIDDLSRLMVNTDVSELEVPKLQTGQLVVINASSVLGQKYQGKIKNIALAAKEKTRESTRVEFGVQIEIEKHDESLKPGMSVVGDVITEVHKNVLRLRHGFVLKRGDKYFATHENGEKRELKIGAQNEEYFEIQSGLSEGDRVLRAEIGSGV